MESKGKLIITKIRVDSAQDRDYWRALSECGIEPPGSISHGNMRKAGVAKSPVTRIQLQESLA